MRSPWSPGVARDPDADDGAAAPRDACASRTFHGHTSWQLCQDTRFVVALS
jgi:hypothetical protein